MKKLVVLVATLIFLSIAGAVLADIPNDADLYWYWNRPNGSTGPVDVTWTTQWDHYGLGIQPVWDDSTYSLLIPNQVNPSAIKTVWWEVKWAGVIPDPADLVSKINLVAPAGYVVSPAVFWTSSVTSVGRYWTWEWTITPQPGNELIVFDPSVYNDFKTGMNIAEIDLGSKCVPEASTLIGFGSALVMAGPGMIGWIRRRRA